MLICLLKVVYSSVCITMPAAVPGPWKKKEHVFLSTAIAKKKHKLRSVWTPPPLPAARGPWQSRASHRACRCAWRPWQARAKVEARLQLEVHLERAPFSPTQTPPMPSRRRPLAPRRGATAGHSRRLVRYRTLALSPRRVLPSRHRPLALHHASAGHSRRARAPWRREKLARSHGGS